MADHPEETQEWNGLKIVGAGFGRTGTLSTKMALEALGFGPCYHMAELFEKSGATEQWEAIAKGGPADWNAVFEGYQAAVDWPACAFYKELMLAYPEAKVLLNVRDPEKWYESAMNTIYQVSRRNPAHALSPHGQMVNTIIWQGTFDGRFEEKDYAIAVFQRHTEEVRRHVPAEKLLIYNVKEGWKPLCAFLGVAVPANTPFPHVNDRDSFVGNRRQEDQ